MSLQRPQFPLFQSQLDLAHVHWKKLIQPGDLVIDATCGNGHDTLFLASIAIDPDKEGKVVAIDKQIAAIESTQKRLSHQLNQEVFKHVHFLHQCHSTFPSDIPPLSVKLIVYNLGYLPGSDKSLTTLGETTRLSLESALGLICSGGVISVTCYPGHSEGKAEEQIVLDFAEKLPSMEWSCCYHRWYNRKDAPGLMLIQRAF